MRPLVPALVAVSMACSRSPSTTTTTSAPADPESEGACRLVRDGFGPTGTVDVNATVVVDGLEVPWSIAFLPGSTDFLVTERPGRIRLVRGGRLAPAPVATVRVSRNEEQGLLGIVLDPNFPENGRLYVYATVENGDRAVNRIVRYVFDGSHAREDGILLDGIPAALHHDGGRLRFGSDGMLYASTGDARNPDLAQDWQSLAGKLLRIMPGGGIPSDNPRPNSRAFLIGIRNVQAFDWLSDGRLVVADHGPSGDLGRRGHDELSVVRKGDNLGWPGTWSCERKTGIVTPLLVFEDAAPPGGAVLYRGAAIPEWKGSLLVATLESEHLHRFVFDGNAHRVPVHEVYLRGAFGRLRDVSTGPDGAVYVTTSNCDGRGRCPTTKDAVLRVARRSAGPD